jgi:hypothetical protein
LDLASVAGGGVRRGQPEKAERSEVSTRSKEGAEAGAFQKGSAALRKAGSPARRRVICARASMEALGMSR